MKNLLIGTMGLLIFTSCGNSKKEEMEKLREEVIAVHDEIMPMMDDLYKLRSSLNLKLVEDSIASVKMGVPEMIITIKDAEEAMMDWMRNFDPNFSGKDDEETRMYLLEQKKSIEHTKTLMLQARDEGSQGLNKF